MLIIYNVAAGDEDYINYWSRVNADTESHTFNKVSDVMDRVLRERIVALIQVLFWPIFGFDFDDPPY